MTHDWAATIAALKGTPFVPRTFSRPDGETATYGGSVYAILLVEGTHAPGEILPHDVGVKPTNAFRDGKQPSGKQIDACFAKAPAITHHSTVGAIRAIVPELPDPTPMKVPCSSCGGSGKVTCPMCEHEHDCDATGAIEKNPEVSHPRCARIGGEVFDLEHIGRLLAVVPNGPIQFGIKPIPVGVAGLGLLRLAGEGWQILAANRQNADGYEVVDFPEATRG